MTNKLMEELVRMIKEDNDDQLDAFFASEPIDGTSTLLVMDLKKKYPDWQTRPEVNLIISDAGLLKYDEMHDDDGMGKVRLIQDLTNIGAHDLVKKVKDGSYD